VVAAVLALVEAHRSACGQARVFRRLEALTLGQVIAFGRRTVTQMLVALGLTEADWTAFYRVLSVPRLDYGVLARTFLQQVAATSTASEPWVVAVDGVQVPRSSRTLPGTAWLKAPRTPPWRPGIHRAQRFVHLAWLAPRTVLGYSRAIPLRWEAAFPAKAVRPAGLATRTEGQAAVAALRWLRAELDVVGRALQPVLVLGDGAYSTAPVLASLPERVHLVARCAKNRALFRLPPPRTGRGRPRKYGPQAPTPTQELHARRGWRRTALLVRGRRLLVRFRLVGPYVVRGAADRPVFVLVVGGIDRRRGRRVQRRLPTFWMVTATARAGAWTLPLGPDDLLAWAWQRWEIEVAHRELKAGFGVGQAQCWSPTAAVLAVQWQVWCYAVLLLAGYQTLGLDTGPPPPGRWWPGSRRWSLNRLLQVVRRECWQLPDFRPAWAVTAPTWEKKEAWLTAWANSSLGSQRA
jgi:hypothetical protein